MIDPMRRSSGFAAMLRPTAVDVIDLQEFNLGLTATHAPRPAIGVEDFESQPPMLQPTPRRLDLPAIGAITKAISVGRLASPAEPGFPPFVISGTVFVQALPTFGLALYRRLALAAAPAFFLAARIKAIACGPTIVILETIEAHYAAFYSRLLLASPAEPLILGDLLPAIPACRCPGGTDGAMRSAGARLSAGGAKTVGLAFLTHVLQMSLILGLGH